MKRPLTAKEKGARFPAFTHKRTEALQVLMNDLTPLQKRANPIALTFLEELLAYSNAQTELNEFRAKIIRLSPSKRHAFMLSVDRAISTHPNRIVKLLAQANELCEFSKTLGNTEAYIFYLEQQKRLQNVIK